MQKRNKIALVITVILFAILIGADGFFRQMPMFEEDIPFWSDRYIIRMFLIMLTSFFFVYAFSGGANDRQTMFQNGPFLDNKNVIVLVSLSIIALFFQTVLAWGGPLVFLKMSYEDGPVENLSVLFWLLASGLFAYLCVKLFKKHKAVNSLFFISLGLCLAFFLLGMEEASWFQRPLGFATPEALLKINSQREFNLHNIATHYFEIVFDLSAFLFLVALPFAYRGSKITIFSREVSFFVPGSTALWAYALSCGFYNWKWPILFLQFTFFISLFILIYYWRVCRTKTGSRWLLAFITIFAGGQAVYLIFGEQFVRSYDITECQEMLFALAFFIYALEIVIFKRDIKTVRNTR
ncbi:MAG: hypothetical protein A2Z88_10430 [Omnitrophica WOR_2 bacterium GWA2_47_8]|nr:MAG: hypothetical protein A2Z88_10430 [Omnitrophica WOR_2 bacterium GWA2_47_8]